MKKTINKKNLKKILNGPESEYLDFKEQYHSNQADLIFDIMCLANSSHKGNRYLIFGISDDKKNILGVTADPNRKTQQQLVTIITSYKFNRFPKFILYSINHEPNVIIDILEIEDRPEKPYFLREESHTKTSKGRNIPVGVYTRICDTNVSITKSAEDSEIEKMFRQRFGLDETPLTKMKMYLKDSYGWDYGYDENHKLYFYYKNHPEFIIMQQKIADDKYSTGWSNRFIHKEAFANIFCLKYHNTDLSKVRIISCDGYRYYIVQPEQWYDEKKECLIFYYLKDSIALLCNEMIKKTLKDQNQEIVIFPIFVSEKFAIKSFNINSKKNKFKYCVYVLDHTKKQYMPTKTPNFT